MSEQPTSEERLFHGFPCYETTPEVWAVIRARHGTQMKVHSTFSDPHGDFMGGGSGQGRMETVYGLAGADFPLIGARTTWDIGEKEHERLNQHTKYFLMIAQKENSDG